MVGRLTSLLSDFARVVDSVLKAQIKLLLLKVGEALVNHAGVGVDDAVERKAGSLNWVLVHFLY